MKENESISPLWPKTGVLDQNPRGYSHLFSSYVGSGPASTVHPPKKSGISSTPTVVKKAQLNGNQKSTSSGKCVVKTDTLTKTNLV